MVLLATIAAAGAQLLHSCLEWQYWGILSRIHTLSFYSYLLGVLTGLRSLRSPLLHEPLADDAAKTLQRVDVVAAILCWLFVACDAVYAWCMYGPCIGVFRCTGKMDVVRLLSQPGDLLVLKLAFG